MERLYIFLIRNDVWIYILSVLGLFWYTTELLRARNILRRAMFGLERERGTQMRNNALVFIAIFLAIIGGVYYVNNNIAPELPPEILFPPTPTPNPLVTPLVSPTPLGEPEQVPPTGTPPLAPTATLPIPVGGDPGEVPEPGPTEPPTATPFITPTPFIDCNVDLNISQPRSGAAVSGEVSFFGTADAEDMAYYALEINGPQTNGEWASLLGRRVEQPVQDSFLGSATLTQWQMGPYLVRLTAFGPVDNIIGQCVIQVTVVDNS